MAFQIAWERVNLGEDKSGELIIGHRGATLPDDFLDDYKRDALSLIGAIKLVPDEALPKAVAEVKVLTAEVVADANEDAEDEVAAAARQVAELELQLKAARERKKLYDDLAKNADKNVDDVNDVAPQASAGPVAKPAPTAPANVGDSPEQKASTAASKPSETKAATATTPAKSTQAAQKKA